MNGTYRSAFAANYNAPWTPPSRSQSGTQTLLDGESYQEVYLNTEAPYADLTVTLNGASVNSVYAVIESSYWDAYLASIWNGPQETLDQYAASMQEVPAASPYEGSSDYKLMLDCSCGYVQMGVNKISFAPGQSWTSNSATWYVFATQNSAPALVNVYFDGDSGGGGDEPYEPTYDTCPTCGGTGVDPEDGESYCPTCGGSGQIQI